MKHGPCNLSTRMSYLADRSHEMLGLSGQIKDLASLCL